MYNLLYIVLNKFNNTSMTNNVIILFNNNCHIDRAHNRRLENGSRIQIKLFNLM